MTGNRRRRGAGRRHLLHVTASWAPALAWAGVITTLSHWPRPALAGGSPDWLLHGLEFAVLAMLMMYGAVRTGFRPSPGLSAGVVVLCAVGGLADEYHQSFIPGREASAGDVAADAVGGVVGVVVDGLRRRWRRAPRRGTAEVVLVGRRDCSLCDEAERVLQDVMPGFDATWRKVDLDVDRGFEAFREEIPVVLVNGRKAFKYRVDPDRLRRRLARWAREEIG